MEHVTQLGSALEIQLLRSEIHPLLDPAYDFVRSSGEEQDDFVDHRAVVVL